MLRLSNRHIQFILEDANYLLTADMKLWELVAGKEREISLSKLMAGASIKGNKDHLRIIKQVVAEIDCRREEYSKENRPR